MGKDVPETTDRNFKNKRLQKLKLMTENSNKTQLVALPPLLGQELDKSVETFIESLRKVGGVVNTSTVVHVGAAHGIVSVCSPSLLHEYGGQIDQVLR